MLRLSDIKNGIIERHKRGKSLDDIMEFVLEHWFLGGKEEMIKPIVKEIIKGHENQEALAN